MRPEWARVAIRMAKTVSTVTLCLPSHYQAGSQSAIRDKQNRRRRNGAILSRQASGRFGYIVTSRALAICRCSLVDCRILGDEIV